MKRPTVKSIAIVFGAVLVLWMALVDHIPPGYAGIAYDAWGGSVVVQTRAGWYVTSPATVVMRVDTRPMRVSVISTANVIASKLIRFRAEGALDFLRQQGFGYMFPYRQKLIMVGYAYSGRTYPFLEVLETPSSGAR